MPDAPLDLVDQPDILSQEEVNRLMHHTLKHAAPAAVAEDDLLEIYKWACRARIEETLLARALTGEVRVVVVDGEIRFSLPPDRKKAKAHRVDESDV